VSGWDVKVVDRVGTGETLIRDAANIVQDQQASLYGIEHTGRFLMRDLLRLQHRRSQSRRTRV
jgi:hypothetical protein